MKHSKSVSLDGTKCYSEVSDTSFVSFTRNWCKIELCQLSDSDCSTSLAATCRPDCISFIDRFIYSAPLFSSEHLAPSIVRYLERQDRHSQFCSKMEGWREEVDVFHSTTDASTDINGSFPSLYQKRQTTRRKPAPVPPFPPQIQHGLTRARNRAAAMESQRLTAWAMARPESILLIN
jgi:hypothetical protein